MSSTVIQSTTIVLPELLRERKSVGKNKVVQIAQARKTISVAIIEFKTKCYLLKAKDGSEYYLKLARSQTKLENANVLKTKELSDINNLTVNTKLTWEQHINEKATTNSEEITASWSRQFQFVKEDDSNAGFRRPQIGALHAISSYWSVRGHCGTIVMPTGTGKTDTMIATLVSSQCDKILVLVPSTTLRRQISEKFQTLGCLSDIGAISTKTLNPRVATVAHGIKDESEVRALTAESNVLVTTSQALHNFPPEIKAILAESCSHLFIDEAHHVPAKTWTNIKELFKDKAILQFTATPFRNDRKRIEGEIIYNYPLGMAQADGYFRKIDLLKIQEFDESQADKEIATFAVNALNKDITDGHDHILMARCKNKSRATELLDLYKGIAPTHNPIIITSDLTGKELIDSLKLLADRGTRILICVDMLGEGFDLPNLKIAALHDSHKSLAITLQFVGRFTRASSDVGDATVVINTSDPKVNKELEELYSEDADWNKLLKQKSESTIQQEIDFHDFINSFSGELSEQVSLWNLRPAFSTLIYETTCDTWTPEKFIDIIPERYKCWHAVSTRDDMLVFVIYKEDEVNWGRYKDIKNHYFELCVVHWSKSHNALFIQCSDYDVISCNKLAKVLCGSNTKIKNGQKVFNIFSGIERILARNVGMSTVGRISYTMHFGNDVTEGLSKLDKGQGVLSNIFGWGYEDGERVSGGCSAKRGKIWAMGGGPITTWKDWCHKIADKIFDNTIQESDIIRDFLRPQELSTRYAGIPILVQWSENILKTSEDNIIVYFGDTEFYLYDVDLAIAEFTDTGPIVFDVFSDTERSQYKIEYNNGRCTYTLVSGKEVKIKKYSGDIVSLSEYVETDPIVIVYSDGSFSHNNYHVPTPALSTFYDVAKLNIVDWSGIDITKESMGKEQKANTVQYKIAYLIKDDYEVIINDDASGEAADIVAIRKDSADKLTLHLIHCKYSSGATPGARVDDFYEVCGQAQKSIRWKHNGLDYLAHHVKRREAKWKKNNETRFLKGDVSELNRLAKFARFAPKVNFEVSIVQPGLSKKDISEDIIQLIASTEDYLHKTSGASLSVYCSA